MNVHAKRAYPVRKLQRAAWGVVAVWVLAAVASLALAGCSGSSGESSPSDRLAGHWTNGQKAHMYFSRTSDSTKEGTLTTVAQDGAREATTYKIVEQDATGERLVYSVTSGAVASTFTAFVGAGVRSLRVVSGKTDAPPPPGDKGPDVWTYVDDKTAPGG